MKIGEGRPPCSGLYVAYVDSVMGLDWASKELLVWTSEGWGYPRSDQSYRGEIYGWIGPLPAMKLEN